MDLNRMSQDQRSQLQALLSLAQQPVNSSVNSSGIDVNRLNPEQFRQLQTLAHDLQQTQSLGNTQAFPAVPALSTPARSHADTMSAIHPTQAQQSPSVANTPVGPYQSQLLQPPIASPSPSQGPSLGHPSPTVSSDLFPALRSLGTGMRRQVNQQRLASSAANSSQLPTRQRRRPRGPAIAPPSMPRTSGPRIEDCLGLPDANGLQTLQLKVKVYPPQELTSHSDLRVYKFEQDTFNAKLEQYHLLYLYELPVSTHIDTLINVVVNDMKNSPFNYTFALDTRSLLAHEALPLQLLEIVNRGLPRTSDGQIHLRRAVHRDLTIQHLAGDKVRYCIPSVSIEGGRFVIHLAVRLFPLTATTSLHEDEPIAPHTCISRKVYSLFSPSGRGSDEDEETSSDEDGPSGQLTTSTSGIRRSSRLAHQGRDHQSSSPSTTVTPGTSESVRTVSTPLQRSGSHTTIPWLPSAIWQEPWVPPTGRYPGNFSYETIPEAVYEVAAGGVDGDGLDIYAESVVDVAAAIKKRIVVALDLGDFTSLLSPVRRFSIASHDTDDHNTEPVVRSVGEGIEREAFHWLLEAYRLESSKWLTPRAAEHCSLTTTHSMSTTSIPASRIQGMAVFGAVVALCLLRGISVYPFDPVVLYFFIHDCNFQSLHPQLIMEWHPTLKSTIDNWLSVGPSGNISTFRDHFATYHELQLSSLADRDQTSHDALAVEMLYRTVIGTVPPDHPELKAFRRGFRLPCRNGFNFCDVPKSWPGGADKFLSVIWTSHIASYDNLEGHLYIQAASPATQNLLATTSSNWTLNFKDLLVNFLKGKGIPCPQLFADARVHFHASVNLDRIDDDGFRARMFCWAGSGSYERDPNAHTISVKFVDNDDQLYSSDAVTRASMMNNGTIGFRTCYQGILIPAIHIIRLAARRYSTTEEPHSFTDAVDHWLLCETLNAIGNHTII